MDLLTGFHQSSCRYGAGLFLGPWTSTWTASDSVVHIETRKLSGLPVCVGAGFDSDGDGVAEVLLSDDRWPDTFSRDGAIPVVEGPSGSVDFEDGDLLLGTDNASGTAWT